MISQIKARYRGLRRNLRLASGKMWRLRSHFVSGEVRRKARTYLQSYSQNMFFVLGTGRSGTQLITELLCQGGEASVFHEPNFDTDVGSMDELRRDKQLAIEYWCDFRGVQVYKRWVSAGTRLYGEVNGTIRYQVPAIHELYPAAKLFLVSRDGRGVVRSVMGWPQFHAPSSKGAYAIEPLPNDPYRERWKEMSRFEKICWGWMDTNEFLMRYVPEEQRLRLEELAADFEYCNQFLLAPLGIELARDVWQRHVSRKSRNASSTYAFPAWEAWSVDQKRAFEDICGETMARLGYDL